MENRKGSGIFLGIVSIATLIVAIIGATFAYFSASTESNEGAVGIQAYEYNLSLSVSPIYPTGASALIPLNPDTKVTTTDGKYVKYDDEGNLVVTEDESEGVNNILYAVKQASNQCLDSRGMQVCALYQVTIHNTSPNPVTLVGELETTSNIASAKPNRTPFKNLAYQELIGGLDNFELATDGDGNVKAPVTLAEEVGGSVKIGNIDVPGGKMGENGKFEEGLGYGYVLIYLNDNGDQTGEMGASMTGKLKYATQDGIGSTLTGMFQLAITDPEPEEPTDDPTIE